MKDELERKIVTLGPLLPHNSLDELIDGLGGITCVAEVSCNTCICIMILLETITNESSQLHVHVVINFIDICLTHLNLINQLHVHGHVIIIYIINS